MATTTYTDTIDFGAYPGKAHATKVVTGLTGILSGSYVEHWFGDTSTASHNADEHKVAVLDIDLTYSDKVAGTGVTIQAFVRKGRAYGLYNINGVHT